MKLMIASDIHGSAYYCRLMLEQFKKENAEKLLLLGDILYHGPRNNLPAEYFPKEVYEMLNKVSDRILCVRGNCDSEVDQMVLEFPIMSDFLTVFDGHSVIYATHGHHLDKLPKLANGNTVLSGHTHIPVNEEKDGVRYLNPGSVSLPKNNSDNSYMIYENGIFKWKKLKTGEEYLPE